MAQQIQLRRDTASNWTSINPTLAQGEIGYETDTNKFKFGDGSTVWTSLLYFGGGSGTFAHAALDNLASVAINTALIPGTAGALDFGSTTKPWGSLWFAGTSGTPATNQFKITGASTGGLRTITFQDNSGTVAFQADTMYIGTTAQTLNRASAIETLTGVSIDGNAGTVTNGIYTSNVAITATANMIVKRDANVNTFVNNQITGYATTVTAASTTTLTVASAREQFFTGTTTQTVVLPDATTLALGFQFRIHNNSSGAVTVNTNGGAALWIVAAGSDALITCTNISTAAGVWDVHYLATGIASGKKLAFANSMMFSAADDTGVYTLPTGTNTLAANNQTMYIGTTAHAINRASLAESLTGITSIDGSASKWTTARNLAGNSVDGSANVAFANKFIVQGTTDSGLSSAQFLGALATGILKNTTTTGVLSIASGGSDYEFPLTFSTGLTRSTNTITNNLLVGISGGQTVIGGTGITDVLKLQGTTGNGTLTSPAIQALVGNNGGTIAWTVLNNGSVGIGTTSPAAKLDVAANADVFGPKIQLSDLSTNSSSRNWALGSAINALAYGSFGILNSSAQGGTANLVKFMIDSSGNVGIVTTSPNSSLHNNGSFALPIVSKTANYTLTSSDHTVIASGAGTTITLPTAVNIQGRIYVIKRNDSTNNITVNTTSLQTIDGATSLTLSTNYQVIMVQSDNANWQIISAQ